MRAQSYIWCEFRVSFLTRQAILCDALLRFFVLFLVFIVVSLHPPFMSPGKNCMHSLDGAVGRYQDGV